MQEQPTIPKITKIMQIQNNPQAMKIFREAVELYGASNWAKVQQYLKLHNMDIQVQHVMRLWKCIQTDLIDQEERDDSLRQSIAQNLDYLYIDSKYDASKQVYKKLLALLRVLVQHFYRRKIAIRHYLGTAGHNIRRQSFKKYLQTIDLKSDNKLLNEMKPYASKFKELLLYTLEIEDEGLNREQRFSLYMGRTYKTQVNTMIHHLAYINEFYKIYDKTTIKDSQLSHFSPLTPATIQDCINSDEYKILFNRSNTVEMFRKFVETQHDESLQRQNHEYSINPFADSLVIRGPKVPKSVKKSTSAHKQKAKRRENIYSHQNSKTFHLDVIRDLKEEEEDSSEQVVIVCNQHDLSTMSKQLIIHIMKAEYRDMFKQHTVECIVGKKYQYGSVRYCVKWKELSRIDTTWEKKEDFKDNEQLKIMQFERCLNYHYFWTIIQPGCKSRVHIMKELQQKQWYEKPRFYLGYNIFTPGEKRYLENEPGVKDEELYTYENELYKYAFCEAEVRRGRGRPPKQPEKVEDDIIMQRKPFVQQLNYRFKIEKQYFDEIKIQQKSKEIEQQIIVIEEDIVDVLPKMQLTEDDEPISYLDRLLRRVHLLPENLEEIERNSKESQCDIETEFEKQPYIVYNDHLRPICVLEKLDVDEIVSHHLIRQIGYKLLFYCIHDSMNYYIDYDVLVEFSPIKLSNYMEQNAILMQQ